MDESKLLLALFCNKKFTKTECGVVVVVFSVPFGCVTLTVTLQYYCGGECVINDMFVVTRDLLSSSAAILVNISQHNATRLDFPASQANGLKCCKITRCKL